MAVKRQIGSLLGLLEEWKLGIVAFDTKLPAQCLRRARR